MATAESERFYDQALGLIEQGHGQVAVSLLAGKLFAVQRDAARWPATRATLRRHPLHAALLEDPYVARGFEKPRGYAGDAPLIDFVYDRSAPAGTSARGVTLFGATTSFQAAEGVRQRRAHAEAVLIAAHAAGQRICVLACGHFREADALIGRDVANIIVVDQDELSLDVVRCNHGASIQIAAVNAIHFLRAAASRGERFDLIYTLGLTDYLDDRAMCLLHRLAAACLDPGGTFLIANFRPHHLAVGWMDAVMDWHLIYREEAELAVFSRDAGLAARTWHDPTGSIAWCEARWLS